MNDHLIKMIKNLNYHASGIEVIMINRWFCRPKGYA